MSQRRRILRGRADGGVKARSAIVLCLFGGGPINIAQGVQLRMWQQSPIIPLLIVNPYGRAWVGVEEEEVGECLHGRY